MNKTNKKANKRTLLIVFAVLVIALLSWGVMVLAIELPCAEGQGDLGNLSLKMKGRGEIPRSGKAEICVNYPEINYITNSVSSYCGYAQLYMSAKMKGKGDSIDSVKKHINSLARKFSCNRINRTKYKELQLSLGPIEIKGTTRIKENQLIYNATLKYRNEVDCTKAKDIKKNKTCHTREEEPLSCQKDIKQNSARSIVRGADNYIRMLNKSFLKDIYELEPNKYRIDADFKEGEMGIYSECCVNDTFTADCIEDSDCGDITYVGAQFCEGRHIAQDSKTPICMDGGTVNAYCPPEADWFEAVEIVEYCALDKACQAAACNSPSSCTGDTDGGMDYSTPGMAVTDIYNFTDDCEDSQYLIEYGCQGSALVYEYVDCTSIGMCDDTNGAACVPYEAGGKSTKDMIKHSNKHHKGEVDKSSLKKALKQRKKKNDDKVKDCFKLPKPKK